MGGVPFAGETSTSTQLPNQTENEDQATLIALGNATGSPKQKIFGNRIDRMVPLANRPIELSKIPPETPELLGRAVERYRRELARQRASINET